jgi:hypothetical protein
VTTRKDRILTVVSKYAAKTHVAMIRGSGGRLVRTFRGGDLLLIGHTGRTSGKAFTTPALYVRDGEDYVVAASNGGIDAEPQWWLNLPADRQRLGDALMATCPTDDESQPGVTRRISLVLLSPIRARQAA